jgi:hypothetical protein
MSMPHHTAQAETINALQQAWPGVRIIRLDLDLDDRTPSGWGEAEKALARLRGKCPADDLAGTLSTNIVLSADEATLVRLGLLSAEHAAAIPLCRYKSFGGLKAWRGKRLTRLEAYWEDPARDARLAEWYRATNPIRDAMAPVIARLLWNPWEHRRISSP